MSELKPSQETREYHSQHTSHPNSFCILPGSSHKAFSELFHDTPGPLFRPERAPGTRNFALAGFRKGGRCDHKPHALIISFFLSECDVGASKAVVNGLAPGSNGQDKGKALEGKLAFLERAGPGATCLVGTVTGLIRL